MLDKMRERFQALSLKQNLGQSMMKMSERRYPGFKSQTETASLHGYNIEHQYVDLSHFLPRREQPVIDAFKPLQKVTIEAPLFNGMEELATNEKPQQTNPPRKAFHKKQKT